MTNIKMGLTIEEAAEMSGIGRNTICLLYTSSALFYGRRKKREAARQCAVPEREETQKEK